VSESAEPAGRAREPAPSPESSRFILASSSPRRRDLLASAGLRFEVQASDLPEDPRTDESPPAYAARMAREKAWDIARRRRVQGDRRPVLGADTIVVKDGQVLGKPESRDQARTMLARLSGARHQVITAFCVVCADATEDQDAITTEVRFKELAPAEIEAYLDTGEWCDKAGSYAVQGHAAYIVRSLAGSYTNVVGLPLCEAVEALERAGVGRE
jgi:septum formation protein